MALWALQGHAHVKRGFAPSQFLLGGLRHGFADGATPAVQTSYQVARSAGHQGLRYFDISQIGGIVSCRTHVTHSTLSFRVELIFLVDRVWSAA